MPNRTVTSREYKLILNTDRFQDFEQGEADFWSLASMILQRKSAAYSVPYSIVRSDDGPEIRNRTTQYLDTEDHSLRRLGWTVRLREESGKYKLTLKTRNADRYVSSSNDLTGVHSNPKKVETKFEEDILPPFVSQFAYSTSIKLKKEPRIKVIGDLVEHFPGLKDQSLPLDRQMMVVNDFTAHETARWVGRAVPDGEEGHDIRACLTCWRQFGATHHPAYGDKRNMAKNTKHIAHLVGGTKIDTSWAHHQGKGL